MTAEQFQDMVNARSGLLGLSEISPDMRDLLKQEGGMCERLKPSPCFAIKEKMDRSLCGGARRPATQLLFSGGIGEHAPAVRARMCEGLEFLGIRLDLDENEADAAVISSSGEHG